MEEVNVSVALSWLAMTPINQSFAAFVADQFWIAVALVAVILVGMVVGRILLEPPLPARFPRSIWLIDLVVLPLLIMTGGSLIEYGLVHIGLVGPSFWVDAATSLVFFLTLAWLGARGLELFFWDGFVVNRTGYRVPGLIRGVSYTVLFLIALITIMAEAGYSPTGLVLSTGITAAVVALALQNTLSDFFSGMALSIEGSYGIDDWIELDDGTLGQVMDIGWRSTKLLSFNNRIYVVPNSKLADRRIHNLSMPTNGYGQWYDFSLPAEIEPAMAKRMLTSAITRVPHILHQPSPKIRLADATTVPYRYMIYVHFTDFLAQYPGRDAMFREIDAELRRYGLQPAAETQEVQMARRQSFNVQPATVADALKTVDLFAILDQDEIDQLAGAADFASFEPDEEVILQGSEVDAIYIVWNGILKSHFLTSKGAKVEVEELTTGDSFGQISVVTAGRSLVTVHALTEAILIRIKIDALSHVIQGRPELADRFAKIVKNRLNSMDRAEALSEASKVRSFPTTRTEILKRIQSVFYGNKTKS